MLVITRSEGEWIRIGLGDGRHGWLAVSKIKTNRVRLAFDFPADVRIDRDELLDVKDRRPPGEHDDASA